MYSTNVNIILSLSIKTKQYKHSNNTVHKTDAHNIKTSGQLGSKRQFFHDKKKMGNII